MNNTKSEEDTGITIAQIPVHYWREYWGFIPGELLLKSRYLIFEPPPFYPYRQTIRLTDIIQLKIVINPFLPYYISAGLGAFIHVKYKDVMSKGRFLQITLVQESENNKKDLLLFREHKESPIADFYNLLQQNTPNREPDLQTSS